MAAAGGCSLALSCSNPATGSSPTDLHKLASSIVDDPPDIATYLAHVMTGSGNRIVRMNPLVSPVRKAGAWTPPGAMTAAQFTYLAGLDMDAVPQAQVEAICNYADLWVQNIAPNQPIRMDGDTLACELGQTTFEDAAAAWKAIR